MIPKTKIKKNNNKLITFSTKWETGENGRKKYSRFIYKMFTINKIQGTFKTQK